MGLSTTDGNMDASASDLSSTDAGTEEPAPPVVSSRFLRALNFFSGQKTVTEIPYISLGPYGKHPDGSNPDLPDS